MVRLREEKRIEFISRNLVLNVYGNRSHLFSSNFLISDLDQVAEENKSIVMHKISPATAFGSLEALGRLFMHKLEDSINDLDSLETSHQISLLSSNLKLLGDHMVH